MQSFVVNSQDKWKVNHLPDTHLRKHSTLPARGERERERKENKTLVVFFFAVVRFPLVVRGAEREREGKGDGCISTWCSTLGLLDRTRCSQAGRAERSSLV